MIAAGVLGWGVWISKPEYLAECESFWIKDGYDRGDVNVYVNTLEDIYGWYISIVEYHDLGDGDYFELPVRRYKYEQFKKDN